VTWRKQILLGGAISKKIGCVAVGFACVIYQLPKEFGFFWFNIKDLPNFVGLTRVTDLPDKRDAQALRRIGGAA
jgi:hypothetical protein